MGMAAEMVCGSCTDLPPGASNNLQPCPDGSDNDELAGGEELGI